MYIPDEAANPILVPIPVLDICDTQGVDSTVFLGEHKEGETPFGAPIKLFYPSDIRRWHRDIGGGGWAKCQRELPPPAFFQYKEKGPWMITYLYLLGWFTVAEHVTLIIQGGGAASKEGFTGLLGMLSFPNAFGNAPCARVCCLGAAWYLQTTCTSPLRR